MMILFEVYDNKIHKLPPVSTTHTRVTSKSACVTLNLHDRVQTTLRTALEIERVGAGTYRFSTVRTVELSMGEF